MVDTAMSANVLQAYYYLGMLSIIYWLASFVVLFLKSKSEKFRQLTLYGSRATQPPAASDPVKIKREAARRAQLAKYVSRFSPRRLGRAAAEVGRRSVPRKWAFVGFYVTGLVASLALYLTTPPLPCESIAQTAAWRRLYELYGPDMRRVKPSAADVNGLAFTSVSSVTSDLQRLLHRRPSRQNVKLVYEAYSDNRKYCYDYVAPFASLELLPLSLFALHCAIRLAECLFVHRFAGGAADRTTLFAAVSGCSFYAFAALSCHVGLFAAVRHDYLLQKLTESSLLLPAYAPLGSVRAEQLLTKSFKNDFKSMLGSRIARKDGWLWSHMLYYKYGQSFTQRAPPCFTVMGTLGRLVRLLPFVVITASAVAFLTAQVMQVLLHYILATLRNPPKDGDTSRAARRQSTLTEQVVEFALFKLRSRTAAAARTLEENAAHERKKQQEALAAQTPSDARKARETTSTLRQRCTEVSDEATNKAAPSTSFATFKARQDREKRAVGDDDEDDSSEDPSAALRVLGEDRRMWYYTYPQVSLFQRVLEPHYTCEILLYVFIGIMIVQLVLGASLMTPAVHHPGWTLLPFFTDEPYPSAYHDTFAFFLVQISAVMGVICFTTVNLGVTAQEHRAFWQNINVERSMVLTLLLGEDPEEVAATSSEMNPLMKRHSSKPGAVDVQVGDDEEHQRMRYQKHLDFLLSPEIFPPYNLFNNIW